MGLIVILRRNIGLYLGYRVFATFRTSQFSSFLMPHESGLREWGKGLKQLGELFHVASKKKRTVTSYPNFANKFFNLFFLIFQVAVASQ